VIEILDAQDHPMKAVLTQALRERNAAQGRQIILSMQERMSDDKVASILWSSIERLAWHEEDSPAARWLMRNSPRTLREDLSPRQ
jgi:hypothetical protein